MKEKLALDLKRKMTISCERNSKMYFRVDWKLNEIRDEMIKTNRF